MCLLHRFTSKLWATIYLQFTCFKDGTPPPMLSSMNMVPLVSLARSPSFVANQSSLQFIDQHFNNIKVRIPKIAPNPKLLFAQYYMALFDHLLLN